MTEERPPGPRVIEAFQGYSPSFSAAKLIYSMLRDVPANFLWGLHSIVLTNAAALSRKERKRKGLGHSRTALEDAVGFYTQEWNGDPARVTLLLDNIEKQWPGLLWRVGLIRSLAISQVLFHELGHHIHRVHRPEFEDKENVAEKWSKKFFRKFVLRRYWYSLPLFVTISLVVNLWRDIAKLHQRIQRKTTEQ